MVIIQIQAVIGLVAIVSCIMLIKESIKYQFNKTEVKKKEIKRLAIVCGVSAALTGAIFSFNYYAQTVLRDELRTQIIESNEASSEVGTVGK